jgi:DNA-binding CsgD family transcriptional regulator
VTDALSRLVDSSRLLFDLQQANEIAQQISGCLDGDAIAKRITDGLVEKFGCAFARIWLVEPDRTGLCLVASSGMYTHTDGSFARVPMGAYKVGKIAQNCLPFLSNQLAEESWVKDRDWALANGIHGFAGYPLAVGDRVIGVLATFSRQAMAPEFLEVLQTLCMTATVALDGALQAQQRNQGAHPTGAQPLSDQLGAILAPTRLNLVGTEGRLPSSLTYVLLRAAELLAAVACNYCRLTYDRKSVTLEALLAVPETVLATNADGQDWLRSHFREVEFAVTCLNGTFQTQSGSRQEVIQLKLQLPCQSHPGGPRVGLNCQLPVLQMAYTQLMHRAGLTLGDATAPGDLLITDQPEQVGRAARTIWLHHGRHNIPTGVDGVVTLATSAELLHQLVEALLSEQPIPADCAVPHFTLSDREQEIMALLAQGLRDRDIAQQLHISESTVKFHVNNSLTKLQAKNRYEGVYRAAIAGNI